jgi:hypothetical protein
MLSGAAFFPFLCIIETYVAGGMMDHDFSYNLFSTTSFFAE